MVAFAEPYITIHGLRQGLEGLLNTATPPPFNHLQRLLLVDRFLQDPTLPQFEDAREFALNSVLTQLITAEYTNLRALFNLPAPHINNPLQTEIAAIQADGRTQAVTLIAWSYLYYRYVRVDLPFSPEAYAAAIQVDPRTLRRYQQRAIRELKDKLVLEEWHTRHHLACQRLLSALPFASSGHLFGREKQLAHAAHALHELSPKHIVISGAPGVGKTAFALALARQRILDNQQLVPGLAQVIWVAYIRSPAEVIHYLAAQLCTEDSPLTLQDYLALYTVLVVIDSAELMSAQQLEQLLSELRFAEVLITRTEPFSTRNPIMHIALDELNTPDALAYAFSFQHINTQVDLAAYAEQIVQTAGGNPLTIKLMIDALASETTPAALHAVITDLYGWHWERLADGAKHTWLRLVLIPENGLHWDDIKRLWGDISSADLRTLKLCQIIDVDLDQMTCLKAPARAFIYAISAQQAHWTDLVNHLLQAAAYDPNACACIEQVLYANFPLLQPDVVTHCLHVIQAYDGKNLHRWLMILERLHTNHTLPIGFLCDYGNGLRRLHYWERAQLMLESAIIALGQAGVFIDQAWAMLDLALLLRLLGKYAASERLTKRVAAVAKRYRNARLMDAVLSEIAQRMIDQADGAAALNILSNLPATVHHWLLRAEALLLTGDFALGIEVIHQVTSMTISQPAQIGAAYALAGRLYTAAGLYDQAQEYLVAAVNLFQVQQQPVVLARAQTNLGVVLTYLKQTDAGLALLKAAEQTQLKL
ncbi:MAG: ATP-binding protein, partial [Armatimonadetes bacterium]|nr:ATP-binding protein [Anaerolineae bacterium]